MEVVVDADEEAGEDEEAVSRAARALVASRRTERARETVKRQHRHERSVKTELNAYQNFA